MRRFNQAPLPFQGQKRRFTKHFAAALKDYPSDGVYVDLFGGSGLLSHTVKSVYPEARVVFNDFDDFSRRLKAIPGTNHLLAEFRKLLSDQPRDRKITGIHRQRIIDLLRAADKQGYVDWISLSSSLMFAMHYGTCLEDFIKGTLYNTVRMSDFDASGYLEKVDVVRMDYRQLFNQYQNVEKVVFLVDPPYLSTDTSTYGSNGYWKLKDYLDVLQVITNQSYFYFTSNKSQIVELCEWISTVSATANPFEGAEKTAINTNASYNNRYTDIMYHYKK